MRGSLVSNIKLSVNKKLHNWNYLLLRYATGDRPRVMKLAQQVSREVDFLLDPSESCQIVNAVVQTTKVPGDIAEVGVYQGGSAKLIAEHKGDKGLHLFDTFCGLPDPDGDDASRFSAGMYSADLERVKNYLRPYSNVHFYPGLFPDTAGPVEKVKFSFVHLDVDLYKGTLSCLQFFYPRLSQGGVLISHDYGNSEGVKRAFDEFFATRPEPVIEVALSQALVVKV